jgi:glycosyltransferase involved in cell wall biosynthesis
LRLLITATSFPIAQDDWRGRFIYDMAESLAGIDAAQVSFWGPSGALPFGVHSALIDDDARWLGEMVARGGIANLLRNRPLLGGVTALGLLYRLRRTYQRFAVGGGGGVAHVNWLQNALPLKGLRLPALVTVLGSDLGLLRLPGMVTMLRAVLRERPAILAPNADWMVPVLRQHFGDVAKVQPIPFGIHSRWFAIERRSAAASSGDWLVVARVTRAKLGYLLEWGEGLFGGQRQLHLLGPMQEALELPGWVHYHGPTHPQALAEDWFPRVQGLLTLSTHDEGRPQVMIEAMAAGLPIIASSLPAHRDLLQDGALGHLVDSRQALAIALDELSSPVTSHAQGERASGWVRQEIGSWQDAAERYCLAYRDLLS